jgi:lipoprotein-releasing system ATP-binding protein
MSSSLEATPLAKPNRPADKPRDLSVAIRRAKQPVGQPAEVLLAARGLVKSYRKNRHVVPVLNGVDLEVPRGAFAAIVGQSGCGKSTLLHLLATLDAPDEGEVEFDGRRIDNLPAVERDWLRNQQFGMIFQFYHLLPELTALENVLSPLMITHGAFRYWRRRREHREAAEAMLEQVGLSHRRHHRPKEMSGGEMQRAAIARALVTRPRLLLADEPTGNLDAKTGAEIMAILGRLNSDQQLSIVMVTHDMAIAQTADHVVRLAEGTVRA